MAKSEKYFEIPRGKETETDEIRKALIDKIKQQEQINHARPVQRPQQQSTIYNHAPAPNVAVQQNIAQQPVQQQIPQEQNRALNSYANYGAYSSPFAEQPKQKVNLVEASHSSEPIKYKPRKRKSAAKTFFVLILMVVIIFGLSWALREFVFQAYEIPSGSMEKTIMTGDMVFAEKITPRFSTPKAGDIITFQDPQNNGRILIKRVIATEGQTIDIKDNKLYIDNIEQHESYTNGLQTSKLRSSISYPYKVPNDCVWVMGDNRTNSQDSRSFGAIPTSSIIGHALFIYWPYEEWKALN